MRKAESSSPLFTGTEITQASGTSSPGADEPILKRLRAGDEEAFRELVRSHHASMIRFARTLVKNLETAEEVVQETWLAALQGLGRFEGRSSLKSWIFGILANRARTRGVRDGRMISFSELPGDRDYEAPAVDPSRFDHAGSWREPPLRWDEPGPERLALSAELRHHLADAMDALPEQQRAVFLIRDVEGMSSQDACNVLGLSETNQRVLLHRARSRMRNALEMKLGVRRGKT